MCVETSLKYVDAEPGINLLWCPAGSDGQPLKANGHHGVQGGFSESPYEEVRDSAPIDEAQMHQATSTNGAHTSSGASPESQQAGIGTSSSMSLDTSEAHAGPSARHAGQAPAAELHNHSNGAAPRQKKEPARSVEPLDSMDAFDLWLDAGEFLPHTLTPFTLLLQAIARPFSSLFLEHDPEIRRHIEVLRLVRGWGMLLDCTQETLLESAVPAVPFQLVHGQSLGVGGVQRTRSSLSSWRRARCRR